MLVFWRKGSDILETRVLRYFLAVAQEGSVTRAARALHLTHPTLSRQIRELEEELGQTLFSRGGRELSLTREGLLLRQRAEEIVGLAEITEKEFRSLGEKTVSGDLSLGCGESKALSFVTDALKVLQDEHPLIIPHFFSGNGEIVMDRLDKGLLDFAVLMGAENTERYYSLPLPNHDTWGLLMDKDDPFAFRPLTSPLSLVWKKHQILSAPAEAFLAKIREAGEK